MPRMSPIDFRSFDALTFDCYGTLIDWESGLLAALRPFAPRRRRRRVAAGGVRPPRGARWRPVRTCRYKDVLAGCLRALGDELGFAAERRAAGGVRAARSRDWPAFADSPDALARLKPRFKLGVITNCDDDLFAASNERLGVEFDWVVTAEQARGYKPRTENFEFAFERIDVPRERILHVAQSLFHDHVPAKALGMTTVWIDRRQGRAGAARPRPPTPSRT